VTRSARHRRTPASGGRQIRAYGASAPLPPATRVVRRCLCALRCRSWQMIIAASQLSQGQRLKRLPAGWTCVRRCPDDEVQATARQSLLHRPCRLRRLERPRSVSEDWRADRDSGLDRGHQQRGAWLYGFATDEVGGFGQPIRKLCVPSRA